MENQWKSEGHTQYSAAQTKEHAEGCHGTPFLHILCHQGKQGASCYTCNRKHDCRIQVMFHTEEDHELLSVFERSYLEFHSHHRFRRQMANALISEFMILLLRKHEHHADAPFLKSSGNSENIIYILTYIQEHITSITLKELSQFFNYSERHLQRIVEAATGMTFTELVQKQKMKLAASLLINSELPIELVCEQAGYASANNFRRIFMKYYGCTPREYRKAHQLD